MKLRALRAGEPLMIRDRELDFSFYMMRRTSRRWGLHSMLYAADPWAVIGGSVSEQVTNLTERATANSFVRQAREYFTAAERADTIETRPLLYYYSFLNLAKAIAIARGRTGLIGKVMHGIRPVGGVGHGPTTAEVHIQSSGGAKMAVDELHWALEGNAVPPGQYPIRDIIAQSVIAHRMWREAWPQTRKERFLTVESIRLFNSSSESQIWSRIYLRRDTMKARGRGLTEVLRESTLANDFRPVKDREGTARGLHTLEQTSPTTYTGRPADVVTEVVGMLRTKLWQTVTSAPPYRRFYLYLSPVTEPRLPQWLSIYASLFWLGSLTRYQPVELLAMLDSPLGPFLREFLETQPTQLLYIMASEVKRQDVAKAAVV